MNVSMPRGNSHGWGIAGTYLSSEISQLPDVPGVTLHCVAGHHFAPCDETQWNRINIGYCFFEQEILAYRFIPEASNRWDHIVAGSSWCEHHLRIAGMEHTSTILQGIDPEIFVSIPTRLDDGRFIVFSGGKFEFRKGHDIVMAAMQIFMARHNDVWLSCAWHNHWPASIRTMEQSRLINFHYHDIPCETLYRNLLATNGIDPSRVILNPVMENRSMKSVYANSDIGLFPNRCEGGNNMVMCEYMACGRPVIASTMTGHRDVIAKDHALCLTKYEPILARMDNDITGVWFEPDTEEIIALLEHAYCNRESIRNIGESAARSMQKLSWLDAAKKFHALAKNLASETHLLFPKNSSDLEHEAATLFENHNYAEAEQVFRSLLTKSPLDPELHNSLATVLDRLEHYPEALLHYEKALALRQLFPVARFNMANTLQRIGSSKEAINNLEQVVATAPDFIEAWQNLALCSFGDNNPARAAECLEEVLLRDPENQKSRSDLGEMYLEMGRYHDAVLCFNAVLAITPDNDGVLNSKGTALQELDDLDGAEECYRKILSRDPDNILALNNLGTVLRSRALPVQAIECFDKALANAPDDGQLIFNRSLAKLSIGDFTGGWSDYEKRFASAEPVKLHHTDIPGWNGEKLKGQTLLVQSEQGYGDTLQFVRYVPLLKRFVGSVILEVQDSSIKSVVDCIDSSITVITRGKTLPPVDSQIALLSLPRIFQTDFSAIPFPDGYLSPDPKRVTELEHCITSSKGVLKVGLVWGGRKPRLNANRSMTLNDLSPLFTIANVTYFSLQLGEDALQIQDYSDHIVDMKPYIHEFSDTAALISCLDLVISIDSAAAHLAGALGIPVWVMLKYSPDWRWYLHRDDSPWYGSARLFRQDTPGDWGSVTCAIARELKKIMDNGKNH